uniref:G-protein coupled receptors family 1 profile domain-containing protein n=1 Tax=Ciona savignyi TaxID=51511 RepID=H2Z4E6_CIOSA
MTTPTNAVDIGVTESMTSPNVIKALVLPIAYGLVCAVGLIGNGLVIYIIQFKIREKSLTDIYVTNLAIADFIFLAMLPFWIIDLAANDRWLFGRAMCKLASASTHIHMYASVLLLTAMAVDRFIAVVCYINSRKYRTKQRAVVGCGILWAIATCMSVVPHQFREVITFNGISRCTWTFDDQRATDRFWYLTHFLFRSVIGFVLPFLIIAVCYIWIAVFLKARKTSGRLTSQRQDKATIMVLVVIGLFLVCWLPNQISNFIFVGQGMGFI